MEAPGRRVMEEQEPSGSTTLQFLGERSHTEWRLSDYGGEEKVPTQLNAIVCVQRT